MFHARLGATAALAAGGTSLTEPRLMSTSAAARCANREERNRAPAPLSGLAVVPLSAKASRVALNAQNGTRKRAHPGGHSASDNGTRVLPGPLCAPGTASVGPRAQRRPNPELCGGFTVVRFSDVLQSRTCLLKRAERCPIMEPRWGCFGGGFGCPAADSPQHLSAHLSVSLLHTGCESCSAGDKLKEKPAWRKLLLLLSLLHHSSSSELWLSTIILKLLKVDRAL